MVKKKYFAAVLLFVLSTAVCLSQDSKPIIENLTATMISTGVVKLQWTTTTSFTADKILIYRGLKPFVSKSQITGTTPVAEIDPEKNSYIDTINNYREYFYAAMVKQTDNSIYTIVLPSINATIHGVKQERYSNIAPQQNEETEHTYTAGQKRELPLPYLDFIEDLNKQPTAFSKKTMDSVKDLINPEEGQNIYLDPYIFDYDMVSHDRGDDYYLFEILKSSFILKNYEKAAKDLQNLLRVNRSEEVTNRAIFYLAESQYYNGRYRHALTLFLYVQDQYPILSKKWIESTLNLYNKKQNNK